MAAEEGTKVPTVLEMRQRVQEHQLAEFDVIMTELNEQTKCRSNVMYLPIYTTRNCYRVSQEVIQKAIQSELTIRPNNDDSKLKCKCEPSCGKVVDCILFILHEPMAAYAGPQ